MTAVAILSRVSVSQPECLPAVDGLAADHQLRCECTLAKGFRSDSWLSELLLTHCSRADRQQRPGA